MPDDRDTTAALRFELVSRQEGDRLAVRLAGDLDMAATFRLEPEVDRLLAGDEVRRLTIDLAQIRFMDSAGLGALLSIRERAEGLGIEMTLANPSRPVRRILEVTGMGGVFTH
jgi:anti-sigma B factor antagonist